MGVVVVACCVSLLKRFPPPQQPVRSGWQLCPEAPSPFKTRSPEPYLISCTFLTENVAPVLHFALSELFKTCQKRCRVVQNRYMHEISACSSFGRVLHPKVFQNVSQKDPKMLDRNLGKRPWEPFGHTKPGSLSQRHLRSPSRSSF